MSDLLKDAARASYRFISNRILWLFILSVVFFYVMLAQLFELQIILADTFVPLPPVTATIQQTLPAQRGNIYDRVGRPLAVNIPVFVVTLDPTVTISNEALLALTRLLERNNEDIVDNFPMTTLWPYEFTIGGSTPEVQQRREFRWKDDMAIPSPQYATAVESFLHLWSWFEIDSEMSNEDVRRILNFRTMIFERRFRPQMFVIATDVSIYTITAIEEQRTFFTGVGIEIRTVRYYPFAIYLSHILGYTGVINAEELEANPDYNLDDIIGKAGIERSQERVLRGIPGVQMVEINPATGRRVSVAPQAGMAAGLSSLAISSLTSPLSNPLSSPQPDTQMPIPPTPGNNVFLTIDILMQVEIYYILKDYLTEVAIARIQQTSNPREARVTHQQIFSNLVSAGWIPITDILDADGGSAAYPLRRYILERFPDATAVRQDRERVVSILVSGIEAGRITPAVMFTAMVDMGILSDYNNFSERVRAGRVSANSLIIEKLRLGELTPQMINIDPATGSIVVVDVQTGGVLAAVSYPSYDINRLANRVDGDYFFRINGDDPTHPMINRPFMESLAPGSTFKMITAAAGLETGTITQSCTIRDGVVFTRAGRPNARCMSNHGRINVAQAISTSCNYFFFETAMGLGTSQRQRIYALNDFMEFFGLNQRTGVEIGEFADRYNRDTTPNIMASPSYKQFVYQRRNQYATQSQWDWFDGDTIRTAIGQSLNNTSSAMMARYIAQIANRGARYPLHLVNAITNYRQEVVYRATPVPDYTEIQLSDSTWDILHQGMLQATEGWGTATAHFRGFPIQVAGKTGTAEQVGTRLSHTSFGGFAPFDNPQIAVYVTVPFGATRVMPGLATQIARDVIYGALVEPFGCVEPPAGFNVLLP